MTMFLVHLSIYKRPLITDKLSMDPEDAFKDECFAGYTRNTLCTVNLLTTILSKVGIHSVLGSLT